MRVRAPALRVCADHRAALSPILRHAVPAAELRDGRAGAPVAAQILFDVV